VRIAIEKQLTELTAADDRVLFSRGRSADPEVQRAAAAILADVRARGDATLYELARRFDGITLRALEVPRSAWSSARDRLTPEVRAGLELAADAIATFHRAQLPQPFELEIRAGVRLGRRVEPLRRVGVYAPGGRAAYASSVLMGVVPARVAGVEEVVVCSPPGRDGLPPDSVLAACALAGADRVFAIGGAGAIAALAWGTESVPAVQRVVGPGNAYVNEAKRQVAGVIGTDNPAGPSELLIVADDGANPDVVAVELLAQAEHDPDAAVVLVTTDASVASRTREALARLLPQQPRRAIIEPALAASGALIVIPELSDALCFAERYAPEHLLLLVREPRAAMEKVRAAGTIFLGASSSVAFGDYVTGANHVLPTGGTARSYSGLSVLDFVRCVTYQEIGEEAARDLAGPTAALAVAEGLPGHALAARLRAGTESVSSPSKRPPVRLRPAYRSIELYDAGRRAVALDLSDNTNLFGSSPAARRAVAGMQSDELTRYPAVFAESLRELLAERLGVKPGNIATGCGSDDVIDSTIRAFCEPGDSVAYPDPTFGMVPLFARMNAARPIAVPLGEDFALDPDALAAAHARITYLCRPNNPTGTLFEAGAVERIAARTAGIVLLDEAYADFAGEGMIQHAVASDRLIVLRTLSKAHGLAGLRVGFAVGPERLIREIEKSRGPYKITAAADTAARAVLGEDGAWVDSVVADVTRNRDRLAAELAALGMHTWPSSANFLLVRSPRPDVVALGAALREHGVAVRVFPALTVAGDCFRVTIGPWMAMDRFLTALQAVI
jgi:histidinol-phosphate aminotransferase